MISVDRQKLLRLHFWYVRKFSLECFVFTIETQQSQTVLNKFLLERNLHKVFTEFFYSILSSHSRPVSVNFSSVIFKAFR